MTDFNELFASGSRSASAAPQSVSRFGSGSMSANGQPSASRPSSSFANSSSYSSFNQPAASGFSNSSPFRNGSSSFTASTNQSQRPSSWTAPKSQSASYSAPAPSGSSSQASYSAPTPSGSFKQTSNVAGSRSRDMSDMISQRIPAFGPEFQEWLQRGMNYPGTPQDVRDSMARYAQELITYEETTKQTLDALNAYENALKAQAAAYQKLRRPMSTLIAKFQEALDITVANNANSNPYPPSY